MANGEHQRWEPAAAGARIVTELNGWLTSAECYGSVPSCRGLDQLSDELAGQIIERLKVWRLECGLSVTCLKVCAVPINPERNLPVLDVASYVGLGDAVETTVRNAPPHLRKGGCEALLALSLKPG